MLALSWAMYVVGKASRQVLQVIAVGRTCPLGNRLDFAFFVGRRQHSVLSLWSSGSPWTTRSPRTCHHHRGGDFRLFRAGKPRRELLTE